MKNSYRFATTGIILLVILIVIGSCKKKDEDPVPVFTMSADTVALVGGGKGLEFFATCTNNGVKMVSVTLKTPQDSNYIYNQYNGASYSKNASIPMQATNTAYPKKIGVWKFNLTGSSQGGTAFAIDETITIAN